MRQRAHTRLWGALSAAYLLMLAAIITAAYRQWIPAEVIYFPFYDTIGHFILMGGAAFFLEMALGLRRVQVGPWMISPAVLMIGTLAALEETSQLLSGYRTFEWLDLGANLAGVFFWSWTAEFLVTERARHATFGAFVGRSASDLVRFVGKLLLALIFPLTIFAALALTRGVSFPVLGLMRYDFLLLLFLGVQVALLVLKLETPAELKTITWFHLLGLAMELFKVQMGSWFYPEPAWTKVLGVPLYSGFMYASVASFLIQVWHRLGLRLERWPNRALVAGLGLAIYLNFFTHHYVADMRWFLIMGVCFLFFRSHVVVVNTDKDRRIPLLGPFFGLGFFIWIAENIATFFGAWAYPDQAEGWQMVHLSKINSWFLLSIISFMLVAHLKLWGRRS